MNRSSLSAALAVIFLFTFTSSLSMAARITKVKGDQILVDLEGEGANYVEGSRYLVMIDGKRKAVVELSKVRGEKALGKVLKGTAAENGTLAPLQASKSPSNQASAPSRSRRSRKHNLFTSMTFGGMLGYGLASQSVQTPSSGVVDGTGNSFSLKGFADLPISGNLGLLARAGFENFSVTGTNNLGVSQKTSITYIDADALLRYYFLEGDLRVFPLAGMGLHYPISKTSDVIAVDKLAVTTLFFLGGGVNYAISDSMYVHGTIEYGMFPPSNDVKTSLIDFRVGAGFLF